MKNKLFLTSMVAVMLACPAYATLVIDPVGTTTRSGQIASDSTGENCDADPLTYRDTAENYGTYTLTAQWTPIEYSVTYTAGAGCTGDGSTDSDVAYASSYDVQNFSGAGITALPGYTLPSNWSGDWTNGTATATGTNTSATYTPGSSIDYYIPDNLTLTAVCTANDYTVTYTAGNGCTGGGTTNTASYASSYDIKNFSGASITALPGYTLPSNWSGDWTNGTATATGTNTSATYTPGSSIDYYIPDNLTLTAVCTANDYTVTYNCNGGSFKSGLTWTSGTTGKDDVVYNTTNYTARTPGDTCALTGSSIASTWSCYKEGDPSSVVNTPFNQPWNLPYDVVCEAQWDVNSYNIRYDCGLLPGTSTSVEGEAPGYTSVNYHGSWSLAPTPGNCAAAGYHFTGWYCEKKIDTCEAGNNNQSPNYIATQNGSTWSVSESGNSYGCEGDVVCHAVWAANSVNLIYLENSGDTTSYSTDSCQYGNSDFDLPTAPTKTGYTFTGWKVTGWTGSDVE